MDAKAKDAGESVSKKFNTIDQFLSKVNNAEDRESLRSIDFAMGNQWDKSMFPAIDRWLNENKIAVEPLIKQLKNDPNLCFYLPIAKQDEDQRLSQIKMPLSNQYSELSKYLRTRCQKHLGEAEFNELFDDLFALRRLGREVGQGPSVAELELGYEIETYAFAIERQILANVGAPKDLLIQHLTRLESLKPLGKVSEKVAGWERYRRLEFLQNPSEHEIEGLPLDRVGEWARRKLVNLSGKQFDLNAALREFNKLVNETTVDEGELSEKIIRKKKLAFDKMRERVKKDFQNPVTFFASTKYKRGLIMGRTAYIMLWSKNFERLETELITRTHLDLIKLGFRIKADRIGNEKFVRPSELPMLLETAEIPTDRFSESPLRYSVQTAFANQLGIAPRAREFGVLYSVGKDGKDHGGISKSPDSGRLARPNLRGPLIPNENDIALIIQ